MKTHIDQRLSEFFKRDVLAGFPYRQSPGVVSGSGSLLTAQHQTVPQQRGNSFHNQSPTKAATADPSIMLVPFMPASITSMDAESQIKRNGSQFDSKRSETALKRFAFDLIQDSLFG